MQFAAVGVKPVISMESSVPDPPEPVVSTGESLAAQPRKTAIPPMIVLPVLCVTTRFGALPA